MEIRQGRGTGSEDSAATQRLPSDDDEAGSDYHSATVHCCKTGSDHRAATKGLSVNCCTTAEVNQSADCKLERAGIANPEGERTA